MSADGWTDVRDKKKDKNAAKQRELSAQRAIEKGRRLLAENGYAEFNIPRDFDKRVRQNPESVDAIVSKLLHDGDRESKISSKERKASKPKERKSSQKAKKTWTEKDLLEEVLKSLKTVPGQWLHVSAVGNRMEEVTGQTWNKVFKPKHGKLKNFLQNQKQLVLTSEDEAGQDRVYPREVWEATRARMNKARKERERKSQAASGSAAVGSARSKKPGCCFRLLNSIVVVACLLILSYITWVSYETYNGAIDQGLTLEQVQAQLPQRVMADANFAIEQGKLLQQHLTNEYPKYMEKAVSVTGATINTTCDYLEKAREAAGPMMTVVRDKIVLAGDRLKDLSVEARPYLQNFRTMMGDVAEDVHQRVASWLM